MDKVQNDRTGAEACYIAGIGASAGGLEALGAMLDHTPSDTGIAFVVVQHLSPNHKSFMVELLAKHTPMKVIGIEDGMPVGPNRVYVMPPNKSLSIRDGILRLTGPDDGQRNPLPIDRFFHDLAGDQGPRAIGIILSGTGSDGSKGIESIKRNGGTVIVQQESNAKFDGMPKSAILTGHADFVIPAEQIGRELRTLARKSRREMIPLIPGHSGGQLDEDVFTILAILRETVQIDFAMYKKSSVLRRIEKRMGINRIHSVKEYIRYLRSHPDEIRKLKKDLLIGVTSFFRDPQAFEDLAREVIPQIFEHRKEDREIRIWSAACATGEEAYSLAILFRQYMDRTGEPYHIKLFATDLDEQAVEYASQGIYPQKAVQSVPRDILEEYFLPTRDGYQVKDSIRKMIVFARHNILKNPPFINLDLIACRNLLIYLQPEAQQKLMSLFHFALNSRGFLFLGSSETVGKSRLFEPVNRKWSLYQYRAGNPYFASAPMQLDDPVVHPPGLSARKKLFADFREASDPPYDPMGAAILKDYVPPLLVIDENSQLVYSGGPVNQLIRIPRGEPTNHVLKLVPEELAMAVRAALHKVRREQTEVCYHEIKWKTAGGVRSVNLRAKPFRYQGRDHYTILFFEEAEPPAAHYRMEVHSDSGSDLLKRIDELELELQRTREYLQMTKEELETSNEELQSTNEELIAANEELQSSNEELQSLNEELMTVNNEYQEKIGQLTELTDDMNNLLISTEIGTIFLDKSLCIRRFTPSVTREIHLLEVDLGRPLSHISHQFKYGSLAEDAEQVLRTCRGIEKEVESRSGKWYSLKVLPYLSKRRNLEGVVLTFHEITGLKRLNEHLRLFSYAIEQSPVGIAIFDGEGNIEYVNSRMAEQTGYTREELLGKQPEDLYPPGFRHKYGGIWSKIARGEQWSGELENVRKNGDTYWESVSILPITDGEGRMIHYLRIAEDITERKNTESLLMESEMLSALGQLAAGIAHEIRNPLTALKGFTKLMQAGSLNSQYLGIMNSELERINTIVSELLFLSKPKSAEFEEKNLISILREVASLLETQAILSNIQIVMDLEVEKYMVRCVEHQLKQVFINLLKNAMEANPKSGQIRVRAALLSEAILVEIQDDGCGIPENILGKIGQPFLTTKEKGTGLGMMVCQKIIRNHDGKMTVKSRVDEGTTVQIML